MRAIDIKRVLLDPHGAIDALAVPEAAFHAKVLAWTQDDPALTYLEAMERAALLIIDSGPTAMRDEFILHDSQQTPLCQGVLDCEGMYGWKNSQLAWIAL